MRYTPRENAVEMPWTVGLYAISDKRAALLKSKCRECSGYGYTFTAPFNPSEKPQRIECPCCNGEGFTS